MRLPFPVGDQVVLCLEPLGAFNAVEVSHGGQVFWGVGISVMREMFCVVEVRVDLVQVPPPPAGLGFGFGAADGWHIVCEEDSLCRGWITCLRFSRVSVNGEDSLMTTIST